MIEHFERLQMSECCKSAKGYQGSFRNGIGSVILIDYQVDGPFWALDTYDDYDDWVKIKFCPYCGAKLEIPADLQHEFEMNKLMEEGFDEEGSEPSSATEEANSES